MAWDNDQECDIQPGTITPKKLPKQSGGGGHEFVTELPETGEDGVEYILMDDISDCETYVGTFVYDEDCGGWIETSGSSGSVVYTYTFETTDTGWRAKRNGTVIFTYVDADTIDSYEDTADGFQIVRNGVVIYSHTDTGGGSEYTITATSNGWVFKEDGTTMFTYTEPDNDPSDGTYFTSGTLTTAIAGTTSVSASSVTGITVADIVEGETLIYDSAGTVGKVTAVSGTTLTVQTITTAPGERRGTRLGAVDDYTDLPATCAAAVALGWQTPLAGDFAYVREDSSHDDHLTEWVIQSIDSSCNITWGYSHTLNAGNYVLDIYEYGQYPSGNPIAKNADGSVTLPEDENTTYTFTTTTDGSGNVTGFTVTDSDGTVVYTYTDQDTDTTYTFSDVTVSGSVVGWKVVDSNGTTVYTYTDLNDESDGSYLTSTTLSTTIADTTSVAVSTVSGSFAIADVVDGETLIYDGDGTVGVVTSHTSSTLTVTTMTVSGSGDASSYVYNTTDTLDTTVANSTTITLSTLSNTAGTTPSASDIIVGKTIVWDADGTAGVVEAISGSNVDVVTVTLAGSGGSATYNVNENGDELDYALFRLKTDTTITGTSGNVNTVTWNRIASGSKTDGEIVLSSDNTGFVVPADKTVEITMSIQTIPLDSSDTNQPNIALALYRSDTSSNLATSNLFYGKPVNTTAAGYQDNGYLQAIWKNTTGSDVTITPRFLCYQTGRIQAGWSSLIVREIARVVDPIKYLDNSKGLQDTPVGNIISYMGNNVPKHYLACDGTVYNVGDYPALEAHFIEEFGSVNYFGGNATTTWAVPDLNGEFLRGAGENSHEDQGDGGDVGEHQDATVHLASGGNTAKTAITTRGTTTPTTTVDWKSATRGITYASGQENASDDRGFEYTSRPTNTSVKYCIKCESTMQVILGNEQYKEQATLSYTLTSNTMAYPSLTHSEGDTMIGTMGTHDAFVAPVDGWYNVSFIVPETGDTATIGYNAVYIFKNGSVVGGRRFDNSTNIRVALDESFTLRLEAGDAVTVGWFWYWSGSPSSYTRTGEADFVLLTSSVDINEVNVIAADDVYSTDEQLVGSYLEKPLYKKTYALTAPSVLDTSTVLYTEPNISTMEIKEIVGTLNGTDIGHVDCNIDRPYSGQETPLWIRTNGEITMKVSSTAQYGAPVYLTIKYTKTTDTAGSAPNKNSLLLTRPDLWEVGTEYDFGGGLYGQRFTGTITASASSTNTTSLLSVISATPVNAGGWWQISNNDDKMMLTASRWGGSTTENGAGINCWNNATGNDVIDLITLSEQARTNAPYDVWVTYCR